jgi:hypothetical protein
MAESDFDFSKYHSIDFNIDFKTWPPLPEAITLIRQRYPNAAVRDPRGEYPGYVRFQVHALVTYELVMDVQREMSTLVADFGGRCESWGVMQDEV